MSCGYGQIWTNTLQTLFASSSTDPIWTNIQYTPLPLCPYKASVLCFLTHSRPHGVSVWYLFPLVRTLTEHQLSASLHSVGLKLCNNKGFQPRSEIKQTACPSAGNKQTPREETREAKREGGKWEEDPSKPSSNKEPICPSTVFSLWRIHAKKCIGQLISIYTISYC